MPDSFGKRLKASRKQRDLTLQQVADRAECSKQALSDIETGDTAEVKMTLLYRLADVLQVSPRWLATGKGTQRNTGPMTDEERDLIFLLRRLKPKAREYLLERAEAIAVESSETPSVIAPFGKSTPARK